MTNFNKTKKCKLILFLVMLVILINSTLGWKSSESRVHQYITNESKEIWQFIPYEVKEHLTNSLVTNLSINCNICDDKYERIYVTTNLCSHTGKTGL